MKTYQLYYTSCRKGLSSGPGFQAYAMSEGITEDERKEIERYGVYVPPNDLPSQPDPEQIELLFPVSFVFFRLKSGRYGVCQSKYVGQDYSGRYGNYFCHALILENGYWPFYPIQLYGSPVFRDRLTQDEANTDDAPSPLLPIDLKDISPNGNLDVNVITDFIEEYGIENLKDMLTAILSYEQSHRRLILCDEQENIPYWIGAIQMAFPVRLAHTLTFTTYTYDPEGMNALICSTPRNGGRFAFTETQRNFQYSLFDFVQGESSEMEGAYKFNQVVDIGYSISRDNLIAFHDFIDQFSYDVINAEMDAAHDLFTISGTGIADMSYENLISAIQFANTYAPAEVLGHLSERINEITEKISGSADIGAAQVVTEFLFRVARETGVPSHYDNAYNFFFHSLRLMIIEHEQTDKKQIIEFNNDVILLNRQHREDLLRCLTDPELLRELSDLLSNDDVPEHSGIYFILMVNNLTDLGYTWEQAAENHEFISFLQTCFALLIRSENNLSMALEKTNKDHNFFAQLIVLGITHTAERGESRDALLRSFSKALKSKKSDWAVMVRIRIIEMGHDSFIYDEFLFLLTLSENKMEFFWSYYDAIFSEISDYRDRYFTVAAENYIEYLKDRQFIGECSKILEHASEINNDALLTRIVEGFEQGLPVSHPSQKLVEEILFISEIKRQRKVRTLPDMTGLIRLGMNIYECDKPIVELFGSAPPDLEGMLGKRYKKYLKWILPKLLSIASSPEDHGRVLNFLAVSGLEPELKSNYMTNLSKILKKNKKSGREGFVHFIVYYLSLMPNEENPSIKQLYGYMWHDMVDVLIKLSGPEKKKLGTLIKADKKCQKKEILDEWIKLLKEAKERHDKSFKVRIKNFLNRSMKRT